MEQLLCKVSCLPVFKNITSSLIKRCKGMLRFSKITYGGMMTMQINTVEVKFNIVDRYWSSVLKRDWYAVLECQTSTVNRYNTSSITDAFHQQLMRSEFSALQPTKNHSLFMCSCILCCWFFDYSFLVLLLTLLTNWHHVICWQKKLCCLLIRWEIFSTSFYLCWTFFGWFYLANSFFQL